MIYYFLAPIGIILLVSFQVTFFDILFMGKLALELSLILVIFAGFRLTTLKGIFLTFLLGFCLDTMVGTVPYFFIVFYLLVFTVSKILSFRMFAETTFFIMLLTFFASVFEGIAIIITFGYSCGGAVRVHILWSFILQGAILATMSPFLFDLLDKIKVLLSVKESQQA